MCSMCSWPVNFEIYVIELSNTTHVAIGKWYWAAAFALNPLLPPLQIRQRQYMKPVCGEAIYNIFVKLLRIYEVTSILSFPSRNPSVCAWRRFAQRKHIGVNEKLPKNENNLNECWKIITRHCFESAKRRQHPPTQTFDRILCVGSKVS